MDPALLSALFGAVGALAAAVVTFALTRNAQLRDRREHRLDELEDQLTEARQDVQARVANVEKAMGVLRSEARDHADDLRDDLADAMRQLSAAVPGFTYRARSRARWR